MFLLYSHGSLSIFNEQLNLFIFTSLPGENYDISLPKFIHGQLRSTDGQIVIEYLLMDTKFI